MQRERPIALFAAAALTAQGWQRDVLITIGGDGTITSVTAGSKAPAGILRFDLLLPGMGNVHTHAFQRAMAGLAEVASGKGQDNFWSWREVMYRFALKLTPEEVETTARNLYIELLKRGYTAVGEFHYLHHDPDGKPYANPAELSERIVAAARSTGIHLTLLPVLYETGNVGGVAAQHDQRRFLHTADGYLRLLELLRAKYGTAPDVTLGIAPHSLRAVKPETLNIVLAAQKGPCPIHIHAAEQEKEVIDCVAATGERPVEWLLNHGRVDVHWCLIHATHMTEAETKRLAASGAVAGLCPTTEANLGDGIFPAEGYIKQRGRFGIGTDSNVCVSPYEELRMLEYAQRLSVRRRNVLAPTASASTGRALFEIAAMGGAQALGIRAGCIKQGYRADLVAFSLQDPLFAGKQGDAILDTLIFAADRPPVTDVFVAGRHLSLG